MDRESNIYKASNYNTEGKVCISNGFGGMRVKIKKLDTNAVIPTRGSKESASVDLYSCTSEKIMIMPHETAVIHTEIAVELPKGTFGVSLQEAGWHVRKDLRRQIK